MSSQQPLLEQLCSNDTLQATADWLHSQCAQNFLSEKKAQETIDTQKNDIFLRSLFRLKGG